MESATNPAHLYERIRELDSEDQRLLLQACLSDPVDPHVPDQVGDYRLLRLLGEGGMGRVFFAERADLKRPVALKLLRTELPGGQWHRKFERERQILARLKHRHIAEFIDCGTTPDGMPWMAMAYVSGTEITKYCNDKRLTVNQRIDLFLKVCDTVAFAHDNMVLHRDLKPANILVDEDDEPVLLDFGVADFYTEDGHDHTLTLQATRHLTPQYAAPEQLLGYLLGTSSDVYSLGIILYELLCGRRPFEQLEHNFHRLYLAVTQETPQPVSSHFKRITADQEQNTARLRQTTTRRLKRDLRGDLDTILKKALAVNPDKRYRDVGEFAADLRRMRTSHPVLAKVPTRSYLLQKFAARHPVRSFLLLALLGLWLVTMLFVGVDQIRTTALRARAEQEQQATDALNQFLFDVFELARLNEQIGRNVPTETLLELAWQRSTLARTMSPHLGLGLAKISLAQGLPQKANTYLAKITPQLDPAERPQLWRASQLLRARLALHFGTAKEARARLNAAAQDPNPSAIQPKHTEQLTALAAATTWAEGRPLAAEQAYRAFLADLRKHNADPQPVMEATIHLSALLLFRGELLPAIELMESTVVAVPASLAAASSAVRAGIAAGKQENEEAMSLYLWSLEDLVRTQPCHPLTRTTLEAVLNNPHSRRLAASERETLHQYAENLQKQCSQVASAPGKADHESR